MSSVEPDNEPEIALDGEFPAFLESASPRLQQRISDRIDQVQLESLQSALRHATSGGKRFRPLLCSWFGQGLGAAVEVVEAVSCLTEWLHSAFLIQDDIQDGDQWRRDRPTLWKSHGIETALNAADWLLAEVYGEVSRVEISDQQRSRLLDAVQDVHRRTVLGQQFDLIGRGDPTFDLDRYQQAVQAKTGRYLALGLVASAIVAALEQESVDSLWDVGDQLGPAFQIQDDLLDLSRSKGRGGEVGNDIREGKPSILYAHALEVGELSDGDRDQLIQVMNKSRSETTTQDVDWVITLFQQCGSVEFAREQASTRAQEGIRLFGDTPGVTRELCDQFASIARFAAERNK
ncbi:MAG: polyprenyl synthetase family protein [Planctomycetota bacterium]|nr:polyprenyl synthetase family protein [Planctomycetota bacterium]